jgi:Tfp pilus assembly protein PilX
MKIKLNSRSRSGYALVIVLIMSAVAMIILGGTLNRTYGVARMNSRAVDMMTAQNAAEAAMEKVFSHMQYDFQSAGGLGLVSNNLSLYRGMYPGSTSGEDAYWTNFQFSDGQGNQNKTYVSRIATYTGALPISYSNRNTSMSPIYRILSNVKPLKGSSGATGTAQEDVMLALIPLTSFAIFYNGLLEFSTCATMTVNGAVHSNTNIYVGAGSGATLTFNTTVTASGTVTAPANDGASWTGPTNYNSSNWRTYFNGATNFINKLATIQVSIPMTNTYSLIDIPPTNDSSTAAGQERLFNQAQVILSVSNLNSTDPYTSNVIVAVQIQKAPSAVAVPGADGSPTIILYTNPSPASLATNLPFLSLTSTFYDGREKTTNITTQVDVGKYAKWVTNSTGPVVGKFPADGSSGYPTILFVDNARNTTTLGGHKLDVVRLTNGTAPPPNGGLGFSVATPDPLYVWGNYNQTNSSYLNTTNTSSGTVPCALMSDALTILSANWSDANSLSSSFSTSSSSWNGHDTTVNAALLTGIVPSTGTDADHYSGGVHNLPRLLEDWSGDTLTLNTSIINLFSSQKAIGLFINPGSGSYYVPPTRQFSYDLNFNDPTRVPPGIPNALVALRYNWATPPPNTVTYNVTP